MGRLIDIDRLCNDLAKRWSIADKKKEDIIRAVMADVVTPIVVSQPTVDAVPVVRCKDCKHWIPYDWMFSEVWQSRNMGDYPENEIGCAYCDMSMTSNDFCSRGERKDGDNG